MTKNRPPFFGAILCNQPKIIFSILDRNLTYKLLCIAFYMLNPYLKVENWNSKFLGWLHRIAPINVGSLSSCNFWVGRASIFEKVVNREHATDRGTQYPCYEVRVLLQTFPDSCQGPREKNRQFCWKFC